MLDLNLYGDGALSAPPTICSSSHKGESHTIRWIIEYLFGKATQPIEGDMQVTNNGGVDLSALSTEELLQYNALLEKINNSGKE